MLPTIIHEPENTKFLLLLNNQSIGTLNYSILENGNLSADHTEVSPEYTGKEYATLLVNTLADYAREKQIHILPICPYVGALFQKFPEKYADVSI